MGTEEAFEIVVRHVSTVAGVAENEITPDVDLCALGLGSDAIVQVISGVARDVRRCRPGRAPRCPLGALVELAEQMGGDPDEDTGDAMQHLLLQAELRAIADEAFPGGR
jgi:hypothetical protein